MRIRIRLIPITPTPVFGIAVLVALFAGLYWVGAKVGLHDAMTESWEFLSGVDGPGEVVQNCERTGIGGLIGVLGGLVLLLANAILLVIAVVGVPIGVVMIAVGALALLANPKSEIMGAGLNVAAAGIGAIVVAGIIFRIIHWMSGWGC